MHKFLLILTTFLILPALVGCRHDVDRAAEHEVVAHAPAFIGPADSYQATVSGVTANHVECVSITGIGAKPEQNLTLDPLELTMHNVQFDVNPFHVRTIDTATFTARVSESSLNTFIHQQTLSGSGIIHNPKIKLLKSGIKMTATFTAAGFVDVPISTIGEFRVEDGFRLVYVPKRLVFGNVPIPSIAKGLLDGHVNPVADLSGLRFAPCITDIRVDTGEVILSGTATLRTLP